MRRTARLDLSHAVTRLALHGVAIGLGSGVAVLLGVPLATALVITFLSATLAVGVVAVVLAPRRSSEKDTPALGDLDEELAMAATSDAVVHAVERTVRRFVGCGEVEFLLLYEPDGAEFERGVPSDSGEHLLSARKDAKEAKDTGALVFPAVFRNEHIGALRVRPRSGLSFTQRERSVLRQIADLGAVALARVVDETDGAHGRRLEAALRRDEREALLETVAAEIAHEVRYPINFFRSIFKQGSRGERLDAEDIEIGCEEVDRLERLVGGLRRMSAPRMNLGSVKVREICFRAHVLLRERLGEKGFDIVLERDLGVRCDKDKVTQVVVNLLSNALDAAGSLGRIGVSWKAMPRGAELTVWDDGPGFEEEPSKLFAPWYTTKGRGRGLGLAITHRLVAAHGWTISATRHEGKTRFTVSVPASDLVVPDTIAEVSPDEVA